MPDEVKKIDDPALGVGDTIEIIPGVNAKIASDEELEEAVEKEGMIVVCMPCSADCFVVPGSVKGRCGGCGCDVWLSPASQYFPVGAMLRCLQCCLKSMKEE
jgi:hypothetical protein